jgi:CDP-diglyceride synthetase
MIRYSPSMLRIYASVALLALMSCDPVVNVAGANFPAWLLCAICGGIVAAMFRPLLVATRVEPYLGPLIVIYPCLAILAACSIYLIFFNRM